MPFVIAAAAGLLVAKPWRSLTRRTATNEQRNT
jgi:hypothetical protein